MAHLLFRPVDLLSEIQALRSLAASFLDPASFALEQLAGDIEGLVTRKEGLLTLSIPRHRPLRTRVSTGEFEPARKASKRRIFAEMTGVWEIEAIIYRLRDPSRPGSKARSTLLIGFTGLASTMITVYDEGVPEPIACWKMEVGDEAAPGCFFHTFAPVDHKFPVPRHPNVFPTPMSAIAFALGELFQDGWEQVASRAADAPQRWRSIQAKRLKTLLEWQLKLVAEASACPWFAIKGAKPTAEIFL